MVNAVFFRRLRVDGTNDYVRHVDGQFYKNKKSWLLGLWDILFSCRVCCMRIGIVMLHS